MKSEENDKMTSHTSPRQLDDLREWLISRIDGGEEARSEDTLITYIVGQIDALPSETGTIPDREREKVMTAHLLAEKTTVETPVTDAVVKMMQAGWLSLGSSAPGAVRPLIEMLEVFERENADLKQRLLPQFQGRAQRAEHERDGMLEKLIVHQTTIANLHDVIDGMRDAPSATGSAKPCPFCGSTRIETKEGSTFRWRLAYCVDCEATSGEVRVAKQDEQAAADAMKEWNRRITEWEDRI